MQPRQWVLYDRKLIQIFKKVLFLCFLPQSKTQDCSEAETERLTRRSPWYVSGGGDGGEALLFFQVKFNKIKTVSEEFA